MNGLALCAGIGGLEIALRASIKHYRTVCYVERDPYCAGVLAARMEEEAICCAPIWDNIKTFDGKAWSGIVDIVTAGFPCQPFSVAGRRMGLVDERWIWGDIARIIRETTVPLIFLENVPGFVSLGLESILRDLAQMGYDAKWCCIPASVVGAPHERERFFLLANSAGHGLQKPEDWQSLAGDYPQPTERGEEISDSDCTVQSVRRNGRGITEKYSWITNDNWWLSEPNVGRVAHGIPSRVDRIKCLGNAVVPAQARLAFEILRRAA